MNPMLIVTPTYNERENVPRLVDMVLGLHPDVDYLFVDDNSPDGTGRMLDEIAAREPRVHVLHRAEKQGLGRAYVAGFRWALERGYQFVFEMDADFSHNPRDLRQFMDSIQTADLVLGTRYLGGIRVLNWPLSRLLLSTMAAKYVRLVTGMPFTDPTGGFKCYRRKVLESMQLEGINSRGYAFQVETTHQAWRKGFRIAEVPIVFEDRRAGTSKMNASIIREALWLVWGLLVRSGFQRRPGPRNPLSVAK